MQFLITSEDKKIAHWASAAVILSVMDAAIPTPLPGVKPGIANIVTLLVFWQFGFRAMLWVMLLRIFASSLILGYFLAPGFFLSLAGGVFSALALGLFKHLPRHYFGAVSFSILAAWAHILGQILLARLWLIPHNGVFLMLPFFWASALFFGTLNGLIVAHFLNKINLNLNKKNKI